MVRFLLGPTLLRLLAWHHARGSARYDRWIVRNDILSSADISAIRAHIGDLPVRPLISILLPVDNPPAEYLHASIAAVKAQLWPEWELCICDDASREPHVDRMLKKISANEPRIRLMRREGFGGAAAARNDALRLANGEWVALLNPGDLLPVHALYEIGLAVIADPAARVIYADEDKIDEAGRRFDPYFKADFDPDLLLSQNMIGHASAYRTDLMRGIGGFREGVEGSPEHDLALRAVAAAGENAIRHIPCVLYHSCQKTGSGQAISAHCPPSFQGLRDYLDSTGHSDAGLEPSPLTPGTPHVVWPVPDPPPLVSVIVPTRDKADLLRPCLAGLLHRTDYAAIEVLIADNGSEEPETLALFELWRNDPRVRVVPIPGPFNYSRINNQAVAEARGEIILLLNNDTEIIEPGWLREMVSHAIRPGIGAVGAKLLYEDDTVQHAGVLLGIGWPYGVAGHIYSGAKRDSAGPFDLLSVVRTASAVTAACLAVRRDLFLAVGGLDEHNLKVAFNDVDLCLRLRAAGYRNVWTPFAELYHKESASRGEDLEGEKLRRFRAEMDYMRRHWAEELDNDPFWNPNLSINSLQRIRTHQIRRGKSWAYYLGR
jgi:O-antigen biosynthesis protein